MSEIVIAFSVPPKRRAVSLEKAIKTKGVIFFKSISISNSNNVLPLRFEIRATASSEYEIESIRGVLEVIDGSDEFSYFGIGNVGVDCAKVDLEIEFIPNVESKIQPGQWIELTFETFEGRRNYNWSLHPTLSRARKKRLVESV